MSAIMHSENCIGPGDLCVCLLCRHIRLIESLQNKTKRSKKGRLAGDTPKTILDPEDVDLVVDLERREKKKAKKKKAKKKTRAVLGRG